MSSNRVLTRAALLLTRGLLLAALAWQAPAGTKPGRDAVGEFSQGSPARVDTGARGHPGRSAIAPPGERSDSVSRPVSARRLYPARVFPGGEFETEMMGSGFLLTPTAAMWSPPRVFCGDRRRQPWFSQTAPSVSARRSDAIRVPSWRFWSSM